MMTISEKVELTPMELDERIRVIDRGIKVVRNSKYPVGRRSTLYALLRGRRDYLSQRLEKK